MRKRVGNAIAQRAAWDQQQRRLLALLVNMTGRIAGFILRRALMKSNTTLNVLALNQPEQVQNRANICYFALSPEDEARDAARHIHEQGKQAPLLLIPRSTLGDRVANAFGRIPGYR